MLLGAFYGLAMKDDNESVKEFVYATRKGCLDTRASTRREGSDEVVTMLLILGTVSLVGSSWFDFTGAVCPCDSLRAVIHFF